MKVEPYLFFNGRCEEAVEFYQRALGAEVAQLTRFREFPGAPEGLEDKIMHADLRIGATRVMASDGDSREAPSFRGFSLALSAQTDEEADRLFATLGEGGRVDQPLISTPFASRFGIVADRFGVSWMVTTSQ